MSKKSKNASKATKVCISSAEITFTGVQNKAKLVSEYVVVPEISAIWRIEAVTADQHTTFRDSFSPPEIKCVVAFLKLYDQKGVNKMQITANINIKEATVKTAGNVFFSNYSQSIASNHVEIDTKSAHYQTTARKQAGNAYADHLKYLNRFITGYDSFSNSPVLGKTSDWESKDSYVFDCSITFKYRDSGDCKSQMVQEVMPKIRVLNLDTIASLFGDNKYADFTFIVRGEEIKVHKNLLAKASQVFDFMFTCGLDETKNNSSTVDCDPKVFRYLLKFIYTNNWSAEEMPSICFKLYELAHLYNIEALMRICSAFILEGNIDADNALDKYKFASTFENENLLEATWEFIRIHMLKLINPCTPKPLHIVHEMIALREKFDKDMESLINYSEPIEEDPVTEKSQLPSIIISK